MKSVRTRLAILLFTVPLLADWQERYKTGNLLLAEGRMEDAGRELHAALDEAESIKLEGPGVSAILSALGRVEFQAGHYHQSRGYFARAIRLLEGGPPEALAVALSNSGETLQALGDWTQAEQRFRRALEILPRSPEIWHRLGQSLYLKHRYWEAERAWRTALQIWEQYDAGSAAVALSDLALLCQVQRRQREALELLDRAAALTAPGQARARILGNRGVVRWKLGQRFGAEDDLKQALAEMETAMGLFHPDVGKILGDYAAVLDKVGRRAEAKNLSRRAEAIRTSFAVQASAAGATVDWRDLR